MNDMMDEWNESVVLLFHAHAQRPPAFEYIAAKHGQFYTAMSDGSDVLTNPSIKWFSVK